MANCSYCGQPAGFLRKKHAACEAKHDEGWSRMLAIATDAAVGKLPLDSVEARLNELAASSFVQISRVQEALIRGWEQAVEHFLEDGHLDESEEERLSKFRAKFSLSQDQLDAQGAYSRLVRGAVLRDVMNGVVPERVQVQGSVPFNLQKSEKLVWMFPEVKYYEDRTRRQYVGGYHGVSIRIAKGLYYRVGAFKGHPVETTETVFVGSGLLGVTNRHLYFSGGGKSFRIRHDRIVSIEPYSDGVGIQRDAQTARPQVFVTGDGWFTYNLLMNVSNL
jgi:hypothetical protein